MLLLHKDELTYDYSVSHFVSFDTKVNILNAFDLAGFSIAKSTRKDALARCWEDVVNNETGYIVNKLPDEELKLLSKLLMKKQEEYITYPRIPNKHLMIQRMYLVLSYAGPDYWHIYMPDSVRNAIKAQFESDVANSPVLKRMDDIAKEFPALNDRLTSLLLNNEMGDKQQGVKALALKKEYEDHLSKLKSLEKSANGCGIPFDDIYSMLEEQIKMCDFLVSNSQESKVDYRSDKSEKSNGKKNLESTKEMEAYVMSLLVHRSQEFDDAQKNIGKTVFFSSAITINPPLEFNERNLICQKTIAPTMIEVVLRLTKATYTVFYFFLQKGFIHIACCWDDILDFVWNGVEQPTILNPYSEVKKDFRVKYPKISSLYGQKETAMGIPLPEPYITTIGFEHQPKKWWLSVKLYGKTISDFTKLIINGVTYDDNCVDAMEKLRGSCLNIFNEVNNSDAKSPKEKMHEYFGVASIPKGEIVDEPFERIQHDVLATGFGISNK